MKRFLITLLILVVMSGLVFAGGGKEESTAVAGGEIPTIRIVGKDFSPTEDVNLQFLAKVEAGFQAYSGQKVNLELVQVPDGGYAEKLNLMLMGGDIPDLIYFQGGDEAVSKQGLLVDLTSYVNKSTVMQSALQDFNKQRIENYPYLLWLAAPRARVALVREDWFAEAGGKVPVTVDDFYNLFKTIKSNHPDAFVMTDTGSTSRMDFTFDHAFGLTATWVKQGGSYVYKKVSDAEKAKLAFYQKLYAEGLFDKDYITTKWDTMEDKFQNGVVGMVFGSSGVVCDIYDTKLKGAQGVGFVALPPAKGVGQGYSISSAKETRGWAISATSKNPDLVFQFLEYMATDEGQLSDRYGIEDVHYTVDNGTYAFTDKKGEWWPRINEVMSYKGPLPTLGTLGYESWGFLGDYVVGDPDFPIPSDMAPTWDALSNLYKEYNFKIITGEYSIDKFDEFVKEWYDLGGDKITEYAQGMLK
ncbi:MAG: extracellular solute-binding protein [Spirochaetia bacterium]|jgi:putative aldouronate transport system substrate-binding protein|nr:extracellular solute-binding protein [Spirochaetia bacterium]